MHFANNDKAKGPLSTEFKGFDKLFGLLISFSMLMILSGSLTFSIIILFFKIFVASIFLITKSLFLVKSDIF